MNVKKKHHYISQFYLKNWESTDGKFFVWNGAKMFSSSAKNTAHSNSLYKIEALNFNQVEYMQKNMENMELDTTSTYTLLVQTFTTITMSFQIFPNAITEKEKRIFEHNVLEDRFSYAEELFSPLLSKIINQKKNVKLTLFDYENLIHFIWFQLTKTPKKLKNLEGENGELKKIFEEKYKFNDAQYHTYFLYIAICFAEKCYLASLSRLDKINIYFNCSKINFITSDDPSFNQKFDENKLHIQLPISPRVLIELTENLDPNKDKLLDHYNNACKFDKKANKNIFITTDLVNFFNMDERQVKSINKKILENRHEFIYAHSREDIDFLIKD